MMHFVFALAVLVIVVLYLAASIKVIPEGERAYVIRLGRRLPEPRGPGIIIAFPPMDRIVIVKEGEPGITDRPPDPIVPD